jgi:hypothetical protein
MKDNQALSAQPRPQPFDLFLLVIGPIVLAAVQSNLFTGSPRYAALGLAAGCILAAIAWRWPKVAGPGLLVLSIPGMLYGLFLTIYTFGMPYTLVSLWGATAFLAGGLGVLRRRSTASRPGRHFFVQAGLIGSLAAIFLLFFLIMWPPRGKAILLSLPIIPPAVAEQVQAEAGGNWAAYWTTPRVTIPTALESVKRSLEADGWTIMDSALDPAGGISLISAQRGAYSLVVMYDPGNPSPYWSTGAYTGAYMKASVRRARAPQFPEFYPLPPGP